MKARIVCAVFMLALLLSGCSLAAPEPTPTPSPVDSFEAFLRTRPAPYFEGDAFCESLTVELRAFDVWTTDSLVSPIVAQATFTMPPPGHDDGDVIVTYALQGGEWVLTDRKVRGLLAAFAALCVSRGG